MVLLLTTPLSLYAYNFDSNQFEVLATNKGEYFGITWNANSIFLSHSNIDNASLVTENDYRNSNKGHIISYTERGHSIVAKGISMPHQILMDSKGRLLTTNTGQNCITITDIDKKEQVKRSLNQIDCEVINGEKVGNHFNSIYEHNSRIYVVAHNNKIEFIQI